MTAVFRTSKPTRRDLLRAASVGAGSVVATSLAGCDLLSTGPAGGDGSSEHATAAREASGLAEQVRQGKLPPLGYGGTLHSVVTGTSDSNTIYSFLGYEHLLRWTSEWTGATGQEELTPNVAMGYEVNDDATVFTFELYPGMRWSNGDPFTADDLVFAVEDVLLNKELNPVPPAFLAPTGEPAAVEKVENNSFRVVFPEPSGLFLQQLATPVGGGQQVTMYPRAYLEQFHSKYNSEVEQLAKDEGFADWVELFGSKAAPFIHGNNPDLPTLGPWRLVRPFGEDEQVVYERNPYYWKVDPDGRQLPYIDRVVFFVFNDLEVALLKTLNGEVDLTAGPDPTFNTAQNKPVLAKSRSDGDYQFIDVEPTHMNVMNIHLNQTHQDETKRAIFQNKSFRMALSHAINRRELIDTTMQGQGEPYQAAPLPHSPFFDKEFATQYLEYDVDMANSLLNESYPDKNPQGIRLGPDGSPISIQVSYVPGAADTWGRMLEVIREYWGTVGIDLRLEPMDGTLFATRRNANEYDAGVWQGGGELDVVLNPWNYFPFFSFSMFGGQWGIWYASNGTSGEEPPAEPKRQMELYDEIRVSSDPAEQTALMDQLLQIAKEQYYLIGTAREIEEYIVASSRLHNVPDKMLRSWTYPTPGPT